MEKLIIKNFACIEFVDIEINNLNIFIGKQASGKSITIKVFYFLKTIISQIIDYTFQEKTKSEINKIIISSFETYFPTETYCVGTFEITYCIDYESIHITQNDRGKIKIVYSPQLLKIFESFKRILRTIKQPTSDDAYLSYRYQYDFRNKCEKILLEAIGRNAIQRQVFIPAGRSFFSNLQNNIFSFLRSESAFALDPFITQFGSLYDAIKNQIGRDPDIKRLPKQVINLIDQILGGKYMRKEKTDYLQHHDNRMTRLSHTSSGQQEILPLVLFLQTYLSNERSFQNSVLYIEEPEAHLFPEAQKKVVELISLVSNFSTETNIFITTHSPYILSSFNNYIQADIIDASLKQSEKKKFYEIVSKNTLLNSERINAYAMLNKRAKSIIEPEYKIIDANYIDSVSEEISNQFDKILSFQ